MQKVTELEAKLSRADSMHTAPGVPHQEVQRLKSELSERECELQDLQSTFEREKALWEGRAKFLKEQKEQYKKDLVDSQRKFEIALEKLQKRGSTDKEKSESNQQAMLKVIEGKYKN